MVRTKTEVKLKIGEWIDQHDDSFTTKEIKNDLAPISKGIYLSPYRLSKLIQATRKVEFDHKKKEWKIKIKPFENLKGD
ncbi:MAG: hypothetical protein WCV90_08990 [Candidatus Woesearchaeota archaeon]|jgi:hypothetical protein